MTLPPGISPENHKNSASPIPDPRVKGRRNAEVVMEKPLKIPVTVEQFPAENPESPTGKAKTKH